MADNPPPPADVVSADRPSGIDLIAAERKRQVEAEGWTPEHDDAHLDDDLTHAAESYLLAASYAIDFEHLSDREVVDRMKQKPPSFWPWDLSWWKPSGDPVRNLVKAGALIAAEIDRIQRRSPRR